MPAKLPAELKEIALAGTLRLKEYSARKLREGKSATQSEMIAEVFEPLLLAAIPIVERMTAKECAEIAVKPYAAASASPSDCPTEVGRKIMLAILSRWQIGRKRDSTREGNGDEIG